MARAELRADRRLWRSFSWAASGRAMRARPTKSGTDAVSRSRVGVALAVVAILLLLIYLAVFGHAFVLVLAAAVALAAAAVSAHILGTMWWGAGAARPVLVLDDDAVRGRLRPATRSADADGTWWDFTVPVADLTGVRLERTALAPQRWTVVLDLPSAVRDELLNQPDFGWYARRLDASYRSPAAWQAGRMLRRTGRRERVRALVAAIDAAREAAAAQTRPE
jgi:hypothetical protein